MILAICAPNRHYDEPLRILSSDVKRAYFFAKAKRPIFIEILAEDQEFGDENKVGSSTRASTAQETPPPIDKMNS